MSRKRNEVVLLDIKPMYARERGVPLFKVSKPTCEKFKQSVFCKGVVSWNMLPPVARNIDSCITFRISQNK